MTGKQRPSYGDDDFARRELHFFWLADYSASMGGNRIATLNQAIREVVPDVRKIAADNPEVDRSGCGACRKFCVERFKRIGQDVNLKRNQSIMRSIRA